METLPLPLHGVAVYNPRLWSDQELKDYFVVRQEVLENLLTALRQETRPHRILVGQRGMGKSTLLRRLALAVEEDEELRLRWLPLTFPEEQYNVSSLADLWRNCLDSLCDRWENQGNSGKANTLENKIENLANEDTLSSLLAEADKTGQGFLLLIDNLDLILDRLKEEQADLLRILEEEPRLLLLAASVRKLEGPFAKIPSDRLDKISFEEMQNMLRKIAELGGKKEHIQNLLEHNRPRIRTLYELTGGNPRTIVLLYTVLAPDGDVRSDLEGLLDLVTPLYKARFEELSPQGQQVMDALAMHWHPMTSRQAADKLDWDINLTSSQLHRLVQQGLVDKVPPVDKRTTFQIDERFFNIWYLMRASRRVRRKFMHLVYFLKLLYTDEEMEAQGRRLLQTARRDPRWAESCLIYGQALEAKSSFRKTLCYTSLSADAKLATDWDLQGEDAKLQSYIATQNQDPIWVQYNTLLQQALIEGRMTAPDDTEGAAQAALHYDKAGLAVLAWGNFFEHKELPQEDLHKAEEAYRKALEEEPGWAWAWLVFGSVLFQQKRLEEAEQAYRNALDIEPQKAEAWYNLGVVLSQQKRLEEAEQAYRKALAIEPQQAMAWNNLGIVLLQQKRLEEAEQAYRKALDIEPQQAWAWLVLGSVLADQNRLEEAEQAYRKSLDIEPQKAMAWLVLGFVLLQQKRLEEAEQAFKKVLDIEPQKAGAWHFLGVVLADQTRHEEAEQAFKKSLDIEPQDAEAWYNLGIVLRQLNRLEEAEQAYRNALDIEPQQDKVWFALGYLLANQNRHEEAEQAYRNALAIEPQQAEAWNNLGIVLADQKRLEEAEQAYKKALELDAEDLVCVYNLAHLLVLSKQWRRAEQYIFTLLDKGDEEFFTAYWKDILDLFKEAVQLGKAEQALTLLEESPCGERWLPLREALAAVAANKPSSLNGVAPEVRDPAKKLLQTIAPEFWKLLA